ncbi:cysteine desulfurase family protein [Sciscionella sediminilitoris]|uniref:cysteine desulfurase family protein n=1 Tax=Sciscionella sediminilitoris TaxID=1445613 RepID=UPI0004DF1873|nr:cysteine desulfurase family protein [Sciscionella sp. SE31]
MPYLDHAATTPMRPEAIAVLTEALREAGNPSSLHASGRAARRRVEEARESCAARLGARASEVIFTGGGTEGDNLAVKGIYWARRAEDPRRRRVLVSAVEHHAVLDTAEWLRDHEGAELVVLGVDASGRVAPEELRAAIGDDPDSVALVSVMLANNEVGTVNPVRELAAIAAGHGIPVHTDAVQAVGVLEVDFAALGVAALTCSAHKIGGPVGAGALLLRRDTACTPVLHGGGQEREVRSGTLATAAILGFVRALELAVAERETHAGELARLRALLLTAVRAAVPDAVVNGPEHGGLPGIAHVTFPGCRGDTLLAALDARGIECSTGSACTAGVSRPSHVLLAMGADAEAARGCLRFSLGYTSTDADVTALGAVLGEAVTGARGRGVPSLRRRKTDRVKEMS